MRQEIYSLQTVKQNEKVQDMRWKNCFFLLGIVLIYIFFPLVVSSIGWLQANFYGCFERESDAHIPLGVYLSCGNNQVLEKGLENFINTNFFIKFTIPTGILFIILLGVIKVISLLTNFIRRRNRSNKNLSH